jgi:hypothetical protein
MACKKGSTKAKGKDSKAGATVGDRWIASKCSKADLRAHVDENLLQPKEIIKWHAATGDKRSYEEAEEIVLFYYFVEHGLALLTSNFFRSLLFYYGIQLHHLNPNSILHISIFVHFCEA